MQKTKLKSKTTSNRPAQRRLRVQRRVRHRERWTRGYPKCFGNYTCKLDDGRTEIVDYSPWGDSEIHPYGEILEAGIVEYQRIPGQIYRSTHDV